MEKEIHTEHSWNDKKKLLLLAIASLGIVILQLWFAKERIIYQDSAFFLFRICNFDSVIENYRYAAQPNYLLAYIGAYIGASLPVLVYLLSTGSLVFAASIASIIWIKTKDISLSFLPIIALIIPGPEMFFLPITEMYAAISLTLLMLASFSFKYDDNISKYATPSIIGALAFNAHPGVLPLLSLILVWNWAENNLKSSLFPGLLIAVSIIIKSQLIQNSSYEEELLSKISIAELPNIFQLWSWKYFIGSLNSWMLFPFLMFAFWIFHSLFSKRFYSVIIYTLFIVLNLIFLLIIYKNGDAETMMQKSFAPIAVGLVMPFLFTFPISRFHSNIKIISIGLLFIISSYQIINTSKFYCKRYQNLKHLISQRNFKNKQKTSMSTRFFNPEIWRVTWALPYETALISKLEKKSSVTINLFYGDKPDSSALEKKGLFYGAEFAAPIKTNKLNTKYFDFDSSKNYCVLDSISSKRASQ